MLGIFYILIGCFLDGISTIVLTMGVVLPIIQAAGIDPLWFGIFLVITVETAQITPPVGFNLFVLQGMTGKQLPYIARVSMPMFFLMKLKTMASFLARLFLLDLLASVPGCAILPSPLSPSALAGLALAPEPMVQVLICC